MHGVINAFDAFFFGLLAGRRLWRWENSPHAHALGHARAIYMYIVCKSGMASEDHVMLLVFFCC
jgi:hypothetical protein